MLSLKSFVLLLALLAADHQSAFLPSIFALDIQLRPWGGFSTIPDPHGAASARGARPLAPLAAATPSCSLCKRARKSPRAGSAGLAWLGMLGASALLEVAMPLLCLKARTDTPLGWSICSMSRSRSSKRASASLMRLLHVLELLPSAPEFTPNAAPERRIRDFDDASSAGEGPHASKEPRSYNV